jgi:hypothetical protein
MFAVTLDSGSTVALIGAEVAVLASLLLVATFVETTLLKREPERTERGLAELTDEFWARRLSTFLILCGVTCTVAIIAALLFTFLAGAVLEVFTVVTFAGVVASFAAVCGNVLLRMRKRGHH